MLGFILPSTVTGVLGIRWIYLSALFFCLFILLGVNNSRPIKTWVVYVTIVVIITSSFTALYWGETRYTLFNLYFIVAIIGVSFATQRDIDKFVELASWLAIFLAIGAVVAWFLSKAGVQPLISFYRHGSETRLLDVYPFSFGLWTLKFGFRPAGIYDEPGALSFFICCVAYLRKVLGKDERWTWLILIGGLVTVSLAHLVFIIFYFISSAHRPKQFVLIFFISVLIGAAAYNTTIGHEVASGFMSRLTIIDDGGVPSIAGDSRSGLINNAYSTIIDNNEVILWGIPPSCTFDPDSCRGNYESMSDNFLSPLVFRGILISWPYYAYFLVGLLLIRGWKDLAFLGILVLLLQRPYVTSFGYSLVLAVCIAVQLNARHSLGMRLPDFPRIGTARTSGGKKLPEDSRFQIR